MARLRAEAREHFRFHRPLQHIPSVAYHAIYHSGIFLFQDHQRRTTAFQAQNDAPTSPRDFSDIFFFLEASDLAHLVITGNKRLHTLLATNICFNIVYDTGRDTQVPQLLNWFPNLIQLSISLHSV